MLIDLLELASNNALQHDDSSRDRLTKLVGKTMTLEIRPPGDLPIQRISVSPLPHGLEFSDQITNESDVTLSTTIPALIKIGRDGLDDAELEPGELEINGDPIIGQRFARVLAELDIDWEGLLAEHLGESPAVIIAAGFGKAKEFASESKSMFKQFINKLLIEDLQLLADKNDVEPFLDQVDTLRADADRLQARIKRLQNNIAN